MKLRTKELTHQNEQEDIQTQTEQLLDVVEETEKEQSEECSLHSAPIRMSLAASSNPPLFNNSSRNHRTISFFQKTYGNMATLRYHNYGHPVQAKLKVSQPGDIYEQEADRVVEQIAGKENMERTELSGTDTGIQLSPDDTVSTPTSEPTPATTHATSPAAEETPAEAATPTPGLIVEDSVTELASDQMKKSEFLSQLRGSVCSTAESALSGTIWSAVGCPWIDQWVAYYSGRSSQQIERALRRYAPEASGAASARDYISTICARVRSAIDTWKTTGEVTGVPEGVSTSLAGAGGGKLTRVVSGARRLLSGIGGLLFKGRDGGAKEGADPRTIQSQLGSGASLDSGVRSRVESAFGHDFSNVRVHTDSGAAQLSDGLNARAFTVGKDIAFGQGEYRPGTLIGEALITHELAHVIQQGGGSTSSAPMHKGETGYGSLEEDADMAAVGALVSMWGGIKGGVADIARNAVPRLKSGLRLQRCEDCGCDSTPSPPTFNRGDILGVKTGNKEGWIRGRLGLTESGEIRSFPDYLKVEYIERKSDNRDYFDILEGPYQGQSGNLQSGYLDNSLTWDSEVSLIFNEDRSLSTVYQSEGTLDYGAGTERGKIYVNPGTSKISTDTDYNVQLPDAPHAGGGTYGDYAKTWFLIEGGPQGDEYLHRGDRSNGCVSIAGNWPTIYNHLINKRSGNRHIGTIRRVIT